MVNVFVTVDTLVQTALTSHAQETATKGGAALMDSVCAIRDSLARTVPRRPVLAIAMIVDSV